MKKKLIIKNPQLETLLKRANVFLKDGLFANAKECFEKVLDLDPENLRALIGKKLAELELSELEDLTNSKDSFEESADFKRIYILANEELKNKLDRILIARDFLLKVEPGLYKDILFDAGKKDAYANNDSLQRVYVPDDVTEIAAGICHGCENLTHVFIGKSVHKISPFCFRGCPQLEGIYVDPLNRKFASVGGVLFDKSVKTLLRAPTNISNLVVPYGVTMIDDYAFWKTNIEKIILPDTVAEIGFCAFEGCNNLIYNLYNTGKYIGTNDNPYYALVTTIPHTDHITIHPETIYINSLAFDECHFNSLYIPAKVERIGPGAFFRCPELKNVYIPKSAEFSDADFVGCSNLINVEIYPRDVSFIEGDDEPIIIHQLIKNRKVLGLCTNCGSGDTKGLLFKKCKKCGAKIDLF